MKHFCYERSSFQCLGQMCLRQACLGDSKQASLSPKYFPYSPCVRTHTLQGSFLFRCGGFIWDTCPVQWSFPLLTFCYFSLHTAKCYAASIESCEADISQLTENTDKRCTFQDNRQNYPHLLPVSVAVGVKGRSLLLSMVVVSIANKFVQSMETDQSGYWIARILLMNCS